VALCTSISRSGASNACTKKLHRKAEHHAPYCASHHTTVGGTAWCESSKHHAVALGAMALPSWQCVEHRAEVAVGWSLSVIWFNFGPRHVSGFIDHIDSWVRNALDLFAVIGRIVQAVGVNHLMLRIGKEREVDRTFAVRSNLLRQLFAFIWTVHADGIESHWFVCVQQETQFG
jgi:hypothetical protein